jgi:hypothetical protein
MRDQMHAHEHAPLTQRHTSRTTKDLPVEHIVRSPRASLRNQTRVPCQDGPVYTR